MQIRRKRRIRQGIRVHFIDEPIEQFGGGIEIEQGDAGTALDHRAFFFSGRRRHTSCYRDWSSDVCSSDLKRLLAITLELEEAVDDVKGVRAGRLSIGASTTPGAYLLPALLSSFRRRYPAVAVAVEIANTATIAERIREGELHLGLLGEPLADPELELEPYVEDELLLVVPPGHRWAGRQIGVKDLDQEALIVREEGSATDDVTRQALAKAGLDIGPSLVLGNTEAVKGAVAGGLGVAFISACAVVHEISSGRLAQ